MKEILLTRGKIAIIDDEDYEIVSKYKWFARKRDHLYYAARSEYLNGEQYEVQMHRFIMGLKHKDGTLCDHKNGNGLDNQKENLRLSNYSHNGHNHRMFSTNTSGYRGVSWQKHRKKWQVRICVGGQEKYIGIFKEVTDAAKAYDTAAINYFGNIAVTNFPKLRNAAILWMEGRKG